MQWLFREVKSVIARNIVVEGDIAQRPPDVTLEVYALVECVDNQQKVELLSRSNQWSDFSTNSSWSLVCGRPYLPIEISRATGRY